MKKFSDIRSDAIRKKNDAYSKAYELGKESKAIDDERKQLDDTRSRIPTDLPDDVKALIDERVSQIESDLDTRAEDVVSQIDEAQDDADDSIDQMRSVGDNLGEKASSLMAGKDIPLNPDAYLSINHMMNALAPLAFFPK